MGNDHRDGSAAKALTFIAVSVASPGYVMAGEDEFEVFVLGSAKEAGCWRVLGLAVLIDQHLLIDRILVFWLCRESKIRLINSCLFGIKRCGYSMLRMDVPPVCSHTVAEDD